MPAPKPQRKDATEPGLTGLQVGLVFLLALLLVGSLVLRRGVPTERSSQGLPPETSSLVQGGGDTPPPEATPLERALPYVTESSLFGLIGFALGYASRKFLKLALIALALFFVGLQALVWMDAVTVDWSLLVTKWNAWLFDLRQDESWTAFLLRRVPSGGGLMLGFWIGFARG